MSGAGLLPWVLGLSWGVVLALPLVRRAGRIGLNARVSTLSVRADARSTRWSLRWSLPPRVVAWWGAHADGVVPRVLRSLRSRRGGRSGDAALARELPVAIDLLGVAVGAGCTPYLAIEVTARWAPPLVAAAFDDVVRSCSLGLDLAAALDAAAHATPQLRPLTDALLATDRLGVPVAPVLTRLADEDRTALRRAAEAHARRIPVRLLFPLVFLVLPAFVLLTVVPGLAAGLGRL
jgi:tight adherence protein C